MKLKIAAVAALMAAAGAAQAQHVANLGNIFVDSNGVSLDMSGGAIPAGVYTSYSVSTDWVAGGGGPWSSEAIWAMTDIAAFPGPANIFYADPGNADNAAFDGNPVTLTWGGAFVSQSVEDGSITGQNYNGGDSLFFNALQTFGGSDAMWNNTVVTLNTGGGVPNIWSENFHSGTTTTGNFWDRPDGVGPGISTFGPVEYDTHSFTVDTTGTYDIASITGHDGYLHLYDGSFNPLDQLTNLIGGDDDGPVFGIGSSVIEGVALTAGSTYIAVVSAYSANSGSGPYHLNLLGPGLVPAPASLALLGLGGLVATRRRRA